MRKFIFNTSSVDKAKKIAGKLGIKFKTEGDTTLLIPLDRAQDFAQVLGANKIKAKQKNGAFAHA